MVSKTFKELQSDTSILVLQANNGKSTVFVNREDYLAKCMYDINILYSLTIQKISTNKGKAKTLKQSKVLKGNEFIYNKWYFYAI